MAINTTFTDFVTPITADWLNNVNNTVNYTATNGTLRQLTTKVADITSVKDFGATGNGVTDDTTAIQNCINQLNLIGGGTCYLPAGTYLISAPITLSNSSVVFKGAGEASTVIKTTVGFSGSEILLVSMGNQFTISDFQINNQSSTAGVAILVSGAAIALATIRNILINNATSYGLSIQSSNSGMLVDNVRVMNSGAGITVDQGNLTISNCYAINCPNGYGFYFTANGGQSANVVLTNCTAFNCKVNLYMQGNATHGLYDALITNFTSSLAAANHAVILDTFGANNSITNLYTEFAGGTTAATSATNLYDGLHITLNNANTSLRGVTSNYNWGAGVYVGCPNITLGNLSLRQNYGSNGALFMDVGASGNWSVTNVQVTNNAFTNAGVGIFNTGNLNSCSISNVTGSGQATGASLFLAGSTFTNYPVINGCYGYSNFTGNVGLAINGSPPVALTPSISSGSGSPNGVITQPNGSIYLNSSGGTGTRIYINQGGGTTWAALSGV